MSKVTLTLIDITLYVWVRVGRIARVQVQFCWLAALFFFAVDKRITLAHCLDGTESPAFNFALGRKIFCNLA